MASTQSKLCSLDDFDSLLNLEDTLYTTAYSQGAADGAHAGRIEGRIFGLEKGFEKFTSLGQLHGRSVVWGSRILKSGDSTSITNEAKNQHDGPQKQNESNPQTTQVAGQDVSKKDLPSQPSSSRLTNNITLLHSLTDPETFSTDNTEEAVADFDDRHKRAGAKAKVIERMLREDDAITTKSPEGSPAGGKARNVALEGQAKSKKGDENIEDFVGSRLLR